MRPHVCRRAAASHIAGTPGTIARPIAKRARGNENHGAVEPHSCFERAGQNLIARAWNKGGNRVATHLMGEPESAREGGAHEFGRRDGYWSYVAVSRDIDIAGRRSALVLEKEAADGRVVCENR